MITCIAYVTKHGCTEKIARILQERLRGDVSVINLKKDGNPDLSRYDCIIVGGSIHAGKVQKGIQRFCGKNRDALLKKRLGLYLCHMEEGDAAQKQFVEAYPADLRAHAAVTGLFGGEFDFKKMNFIERNIVRNIAKIEESVSRIDMDAVHAFAKKFETVEEV